MERPVTRWLLLVLLLVLGTAPRRFFSPRFGSHFDCGVSQGAFRRSRKPPPAPRTPPPLLDNRYGKLQGILFFPTVIGPVPKNCHRFCTRAALLRISLARFLSGTLNAFMRGDWEVEILAFSSLCN